MRTRGQRLLVGLAVTLIAAGAGVVAGYLLGRAVMLRQAERRLDQFAARIQADAETSATESRAILASMNASPFPFCSDSEIAYFRKLIFQSQYLKEGGRMRAGKIECSTTLGRIAETRPQPAEPVKPDISRHDGTRVYRDLAPFGIAGQTVITIGLGDSYIVYNPYNLKVLASPPMRYTVTNVDVSTGQLDRLLGDLPPVDRSNLTREGESRQGETLFATRCSQRFQESCMTAYLSVPEVLQAERGQRRTYMLLLGASGAIFGVLCSLVYQRNRSLEQQLRRAVENGRLGVLYQPIVQLAGGKIEGVEALARWKDEQGSPVSPEVFIRIAEERGFVGDITRVVLDRALRDFGDVVRRRPHFTISLNVTASDLSDPKFLPMLERSLERAAVPARNISIEITEGSTARHNQAIETIRRLRQAGHQVHIDDFGTGFSSLAYLHDLSVDAIKIDKSFTRAIGTGAVTSAILPQILAMAEALGLQVIVEGIETREQAEYFASSTRAILAQGWLYGRPAPADSLIELLNANESLAPLGSA